MESDDMHLLTVVAEAILEDTLIDEARAMGAAGYTVTDTRGWGRHGKRRGNWRQGGNIKIEVVASAELCDRIAARFKEQYEADYGLLMFTIPVALKN
ncbi:nitrogen regulatory protein P-II [Thioalkalivibrio sp. ALMg11]|uniref:P-II family nitrogen regulator n=1 Tax=Thioalkalivibrio sp. ALMg11 TaxID=1158165 RepID=UPI0003A48EAF|nr:nitrogen regulatory protein P-II [Thioalkalivibrio sp. ALMg11]